ncbi:MAG: DUF2092 domain-containing protein [Candidatus Hydrogenedentes bacterium]|nr:DUF2092 domain-containing protein [Candidatus Hydrogenedentota bacterium]
MIASRMRAVLFTFAIACAFESGAQPAAGIDPKVRDVVNAMSAYYKSLTTTTFSYSVKLDREMNERKSGIELDFAVAIERPNRISFVQGKSKEGVDLVSNGKELAISIPELNKYVVETAPDSIADSLEWGALSNLTEFNSIIGELMGQDPAAAILDGVSQASYVGEEAIEGKQHHRIRLVQEEMEVDLWIAAGERPFLARMTPDWAKLIGDDKIKLDLNITFTGWTANDPIPPERFVFSAPATSTKAASFDALFGMDEKLPAAALLGKAAPSFTLNGLDGKPIDLSEYLGKNVIVLDFWATWCGPCVRSMPVLVDVTDSFKDKGVVFIAVNLGEESEDVRRFFQELKLTANVALDVEKTAAQHYLVDPIPQTVLIGKTGNVEAIHVGASPVLRQELKSQLSKLVAGQSLVDTGV